MIQNLFKFEYFLKNLISSTEFCCRFYSKTIEFINFMHLLCNTSVNMHVMFEICKNMQKCKNFYVNFYNF